MNSISHIPGVIKAPVTPSRASLAGKFTGTIFVARSCTQKARACQYFKRISHGLAHKCARRQILSMLKILSQ